VESPVIASKYRVLSPIGEGGMGVVHAGEHIDLKAPVAIKLLQPKLAEDATARARFLREARLAASIDAEHSTRIFDVGVDDDGRPYMAMELLTGEAMDKRIARTGPLRVEEATTALIQVLDALAVAHAKGLVHRDLKPANLFLVEKPGEPIWIKVVDFGISKATAAQPVDATSDTLRTLTAPRTILGSPHYMSPEQLRDSASVDARADLWACGVVLFELLTGRMPFDAASLPDLCAQIVSGEPRPLAAYAPAPVPSAVERMIERCLRKDPAERPQTAYELAAALAPFASESARALLPRIRAQGSVEDLPAGPAPAPRSLAGVGVVLLAGALAFVAASFGGGRATSGSPSGSLPALEPIPAASAMTAPLPSASSSAAPPPRAAVDAAPSTSAAPSARRAGPRPPRAGAPRARDLDSIDLLQ
jgi:serine/threonine protein kinase